jgi:hypothetical protein
MTDALTAHIIAGQNLFLLVIDSLLTFPPLYSSLLLDKHSYYLAFEDGLQLSRNHIDHHLNHINHHLNTSKPC